MSGLRRISIQRMRVAQLTQLADEWRFFQSPFGANKMFCLLNKFGQGKNSETSTVGQNRKLGITFPIFLIFPSFRFATFSFFVFLISFCNYSSTHYFINTVRTVRLSQ